MELNSQSAKVVISKGNALKYCVINGIERLGGLKNYIKNDDQVFIKFNLNFPEGFPTNTNLDILEVIIQLCNIAGAKKIFIGGFPFKGIPIKSISDLLGLQNYINYLGAELAFLDNSDQFFQIKLNVNSLKNIKRQTTAKIKINSKEFEIPKVILDSDKVISINQVNVDPIFNVRLSINNSFSLVSNKNQENYNKSYEDINFEKNFNELTSHIMDIFSIKIPNLIINDLFYVLEGAGPSIYKDSNLKKTGIIVLGNDALAVDIITMKLLNLDINTNKLLIEAKNRKLGISDTSAIQIIGENIESIKLNIKPCVSKLEDIKIVNFSIKAGQINLEEYQQAYHLLNFIKTHMIKDLKYISKTSFLIGKDPPEPEFLQNIIVFGDNAIKSMKKREFKIQNKKGEKIKKSKNILVLPGNPPNFFDCIDRFLKFYGKKDLPNLNLIQNMNNINFSRKVRRKLEIWEDL
jgi:uncharacterized protein (DUF362 family)